jgi:hypothetical protein
VVVGLCVALSTTAAASPPLRRCHPELRIAETIDDRARVRASVRDEVCSTLRAHGVRLPKAPDDASLVVEVGGVGSQWQLWVRIERDGVPVGAGESRACRCDVQTMLVELSSATVAVVPLLRADDDATTTPNDGAMRPSPPPPANAITPAPLGTQGKVGIGLLAAGTAGTFIGIGLVASGSRVNGRIEREGRDLRPAGYALLGASLATGIVGAVLLGLDRRRARRLRGIAPVLGPRALGLELHGRF